MQLPATSDTIVAVSTAWSPSPLGVIRLSGPRAFELARMLGAEPPASAAANPGARFSQCRLAFAHPPGVADADPVHAPALAYWFSGPRSYTGQDIVEFHTPGCLPLLRAIADQLVVLGARAALPGEFTLRAYLNGKLARSQVERIPALIHASDVAAIRAAARAEGAERAARLADLCARVENLLAAIEACIDFVEEEDIRFISREQSQAALREIERAVRELLDRDRRRQRNLVPHVALAGLPNAGKSTLFNALIGQQRAIVSPIIGTTRDVLSAEIALNGIPVVLQDCAGLTAPSLALDIAANQATLSALGRADVLLWVHPRGWSWTPPERDYAARYPAERRLLVYSMTDRAGECSAPPSDLVFAAQVEVSAATGRGTAELRGAIARELATLPPAAPSSALVYALETAERAQSLLAIDAGENSELLALELRNIWNALTSHPDRTADEAVLSLIFSQFCIGK